MRSIAPKPAQPLAHKGAEAGAQPRHILITGGAGFIGANLVQHLLEPPAAEAEGFRLTVLDKLTYAGRRENLARWEQDARFRFVQGDVADAGLLQALLAEGVTQVVHCAAESHVDRSIREPSAFIQTNLVGTFTLLEALRQAGWCPDAAQAEAPLVGQHRRMLLHVSTDEVYGSLGAEGSFEESSPYQPSSPYSASKAGADHLVRAYGRTYGLPAIITTCSNNYGPMQFPEKLIPFMVLAGLAGRPMPVYGDGEQIRDWIHVKDHCRAMEALLTDGRAGNTYVIGARAEYSTLAITHAICDALDERHPEGAPHRRLITFVPERPGQDRRYAVDPARLERDLGWKPAQDFAEGLRATVDWYLHHREWWEAIRPADYENRYWTDYA